MWISERDIRYTANRKGRPDDLIRRLLFMTNFCDPNKWSFVGVFDDGV